MSAFQESSELWLEVGNASGPGDRDAAAKQAAVDAVLAEKAKRESKSVGYEMPTRESFVEFMAGMSDKAQSQYIEWLLDYMDDYKSGIDNEEASFAWIKGNRTGPMRSLDRMRTKTPATCAGDSIDTMVAGYFETDLR